MSCINISMKCNEIIPYVLAERARRTRTNKTTLAAPSKATSKPLEDEPNNARVAQSSGAVTKGYKGPVIAVMELPPKQVL
jgi:hypothetical protein